MQKEIMMLVSDVKYYQDQGSMIIVGKEVETQRPITQQVTVKAFLENTGLFSPGEVAKVVNDPDRCRLLASELKGRRSPFKLLFEDTQSEAERKAFFEIEANRTE